MEIAKIVRIAAIMRTPAPAGAEAPDGRVTDRSTRAD